MAATSRATDNDALAVTPPPWRRDLTIAADLVEEIARIEGYDRIPAVVPSVRAHDISSAAFELESQIARTLAALGYREVITHSLRATASSDAVEVRNPISEEHRFLRESLAPGLIAYLAAVGAPARVFEIGDIFRTAGQEIVEQTSVGFAFSVERSDEPPWRDSSFLRLKGDCEALVREVTGRATSSQPATRPGFHPGKTAVVAIDGVEIGVIGCVDPRLAKARDLKGNAYLCLLDVRALPPYATPRYTAAVAISVDLSRPRARRRDRRRRARDRDARSRLHSVRSAPASQSSTNTGDRRSATNAKVSRCA